MSTSKFNEYNNLSSSVELPGCHRQAVLSLLEAFEQGRNPYELGARKVRALKGVWRFRIGRKYRLLCWEEDGQRKFELVTRQALECAIARR
ncbi:MAG: type II toxin-antitoxin system RelE family toxin [Alcanivorax sediminis]|uniref:type II toxin-antitoxin system RelE family toxin n=1 Tax=Alcanivorax sediminis TaxID=2663008 RepID=UPI003C3B9850